MDGPHPRDDAVAVIRDERAGSAMDEGGAPADGQRAPGGSPRPIKLMKKFLKNFEGD